MSIHILCTIRPWDIYAYQYEHFNYDIPGMYKPFQRRDRL